ncbi:CpmK protein [Xenorhabdus littoralis]|uniref:CpmK protein n=1 Tax=Xenorhabdus littoralis TaxID=2582835 RepID=UPI0029E80949|nr:CpmK protein [Xenorhabdus sp. Reich]
MRIVIFVLSFFLSGFCYAINEYEYMDKIQKVLDNQPPLCLDETQWPVSINNGDSVWINAKMESLVDAGLVEPKMKEHKKIWSLTPLGSKEFKRNGDLCYGRIIVKNIDSITYINEKKGFVIFSYYIKSLPEWAKNKSVRVAYSYLDNIVTGINVAKYQVEFERLSSGVIKITGEPSQLDLLY